MKGMHVETIDRNYVESFNDDLMNASDDYWQGYHQALAERPIRWGPSALDVVTFVAGVLLGVVLAYRILRGW